jgi:signal transduction histidine kinase
MAAAHGGGTLTVRTRSGGGSTEGAHETVRIEIEDDGPGISPGSLDQMFDPFFTTRSAEGGAGLGLSISQEIVVDHGGKIWAEHRPSGGAIFSVELPVIRISKRPKSPNAAGVQGS